MHNLESNKKSGCHSDKFSNCHRTNKNVKQNTQSVSKSPNEYQTDSDTDSSTSKYVVREDNRERRDGPGGN
ncbi:MAG: hypothetical protein HFI34_12560 [Lachnospiraceae bacterium]|nr:hypothetical protein [Lachnospiraceae bacterium]